MIENCCPDCGGALEEDTHLCDCRRCHRQGEDEFHCLDCDMVWEKHELKRRLVRTADAGVE